MLNKIVDIKNPCTFVSTVLATLPTRTASQGESFAFIKLRFQNNTPSTPLNNAHLEGFFFYSPFEFTKYDLF
jgi:hypothetical protein